MTCVFIAYEPRADDIDITAFREFVESFPDVVAVQDNLYVVKTELSKSDFDNQLFAAAGNDVRFTTMPAGLDASLWNFRPGALDAFHKLLNS